MFVLRGNKVNVTIRENEMGLVSWWDFSQFVYSL